MTRLTSCRAAAVAVTGLVLGVCNLAAAPLPAATAAPPERLRPVYAETPAPADDPELPEVPLDPLAVRIERLTPSVMPRRGPVTVAGRVRNTSTSVWEGLSAYLVVSSRPMTSAEELAEAVLSDPRTDVGDRIVDPGLYVNLPDLDPGDVAPFRLSVPRSRLAQSMSGEAGVYWLAVHVLGETEGGRLEGADGRARTFLPLVPPATAPTELALGLQLRKPSRRAADGSLEDAEDWRSAVSAGGRLQRVLRLGASAEGASFSWILDPAVVDSVRSAARGDPPLAVDTEEPGDQSASAAAWLDELVGALGASSAGSAVLALPYADPDVSALARFDADGLLARAWDEGGQLLDDLAVDHVPAVVDPLGRLAPVALDRLDPETRVVLDSAAGPVDDGGDAGAPLDAAGPVARRAGGGAVLLAPTPETVQGPGPTGVRSALGVRQRLLADAAVHALSGAEDPLVRILPPLWDPGPSWRKARFFRGLSVPWLDTLSLTRAADAVGADALDPLPERDYPTEAVDAELPVAPVRAAQALVASGAVLDEVLVDNDTVGARLGRAALTSVSVWDRERAALATDRALDTSARVEELLDRVEVRSAAFVTMSSETGEFPVNLVNGLDQAVAVDLRVSVVGRELVVTSPARVELPPSSRRALRIEATARDIGVHQVTIQPVTESGTAVGRPAVLSVRTSRVGFILWLVMAVGGTILFGAVALRVWRRVRRRRATHGPLLDLARR